MDLIEKVRAVETVFGELDNAISAFQTHSTLHCKAGCGKCCFKPDIEATILEFLPLAHYLYQHDLAHEWLDKVSPDGGLCPVLDPMQSGVGLCSQYTHRGLICRLFGYSARLNKYGKKELITCQIIKTEQAEAFDLAQKKLDDDTMVPVMSHYYMQLHAIDAELARNFYPIRIAVRKAIETVLHYYAYRN